MASGIRKRVVPGFGLSLGLTLAYTGVMVLIPMASLVFQSSSLGWSEFWAAVTDPRILASYRVSFVCSFVAACINAVFGLLLAWVLVRYRFPGRRILDGLIELPFALPTAVAGISLTALYSNKGFLGKPLEDIGIKVAYTQVGIIIALTFIGLPFIVRAVQPVLEEMDSCYEEAALILGASRTRVFFTVILPEILPAALTGFGLAFGRGLGEYGSVIFIAGNMPYKTEIAPLLIMTKLEQFNYDEATAVALVMLIASFTVMFLVNCVQSRKLRYLGHD